MLPDLTDEGLLPTGRHRATLADLEEVFVKRAPYATERELIWGSFLLWERRVAALLPGPRRMWINGGFVTHKEWEAPDDIDVVLICRLEDVNAAGDALAPLFTQQADGRDAPRIQPMSGHVDAFPAFRGNAGALKYWDGLWSGVRLRDGTIDTRRVKGYVEVVSEW